MNSSWANENYTYSSLTLSYECRQYLCQLFFTVIPRVTPTIEYLAEYWDIDPIYNFFWGKEILITMSYFVIFYILR
jgi:hypothetical protein